MINVDSLIDYRFPKLRQRYHVMLKPITIALRMLFHETELKRFAATYPHRKGLDFIEQMLEHFSFTYTLKSRDIERIPVQGRVVIIANHPIGTLDSAVLLKMVGDVRSDVKALANEVMSGISQLESLILPVNNMHGSSSKEQLKAVYQHLNQEGALIIFPAGEVSRMGPTGIKDGTWNSGFLRIATALRAPILPIFVNGRNSVFFYALSMLAKPLSTLWLVREMFKQANRSVSVSIGEMITYESYQKTNLSLVSKVKLFQRHLYRVGKQKTPLFETTSAIAHPEKRQPLRQEIKACELLGQTWDGKKIYLFNYHADCAILREIGRLREISFRAVGEGTGFRRDTDIYDQYCSQLILWDDDELEIVGAYRLSASKTVQEQYGLGGIYTQSLFEFKEGMNTTIELGLELGRSFVQPKYWGKRSLDYLWFGIGAFLRKYPEFRYLYGPVSISGTYPPAAKDLLVYFFDLYFGTSQYEAKARTPYRLDKESRELLSTQFSGLDYKKDFRHLKASLKHMGCVVPTLFKQYAELCETGGVRFIDFNIDADFANCIDGLVVVDITKILADKHKRYIQETPTNT
ncbi:MAG: GNAT family N-acetyltransferase [Zetaproteobacteria bacterium CG2_30_46_52]|nr:MAG: GNAT family N-acetyltransferase [Zetaproteobacteria bacterium CG2_30_46_52]